jgi:hypothetical protein
VSGKGKGKFIRVQIVAAVGKWRTSRNTVLNWILRIRVATSWHLRILKTVLDLMLAESTSRISDTRVLHNEISFHWTLAESVHGRKECLRPNGDRRRNVLVTHAVSE